MSGRERETGIVQDCQNENLATHLLCQISKFLATKPLTINQLSWPEHALKTHLRQRRIQKFSG
jgi:hypothetical protein